MVYFALLQASSSTLCVVFIGATLDGEMENWARPHPVRQRFFQLDNDV